jgi:uncharacterized membrane protein
LARRIPPLRLITSSGNLHLFSSKWSQAMKRMNLSKILSAAASIGGSIVATSVLAQSQGGYGPGGMMGGYGAGWMGGGYGGIWVPILLVAVVAGVVAWVVTQKRK